MFCARRYARLHAPLIPEITLRHAHRILLRAYGCFGFARCDEIEAKRNPGARLNAAGFALRNESSYSGLPGSMMVRHICAVALLSPLTATVTVASDAVA